MKRHEPEHNSSRESSAVDATTRQLVIVIASFHFELKVHRGDAIYIDIKCLYLWVIRLMGPTKNELKYKLQKGFLQHIIIIIV